MFIKRAAKPSTILEHMRRTLDQHEGDTPGLRWFIGDLAYAQLRCESGDAVNHGFGIPIVIMPGLIGVGLHVRRDMMEPW